MSKNVRRKDKSAFSSEIEAFIRTFVEELINDNAAIFAGAGLSASRGYVNWKELLRGIAEGLNLDVDRETNLVALAQFHLNERRNRSELNRRIVAEFSDTREPSENHRILARLPISTYWTTNYDKLIETSLRNGGKIVDVKYDVAQLKTTLPNRDVVLYKMHGDVDHAEEAVLTKDDYEGYFRKHEPFVTALSGHLTSKTFLFLGFSFSDPNIDYVMSRVRVMLHNAPKQQYCIMRREQKAAKEKKESFAYRKHQQTFLIKDLQRIGVHTLLVDEYDDITRILGRIESDYRQRTILVSGSADDFQPWEMRDANRFVANLSRSLIEKHYSIVTGIGLGIGPSVIAGALEPILLERLKFRQSQLIARPFPFAIEDKRERERVHEAYRQQMVDACGIAIFIFGNKRKGKETKNASGVLREFEVAVEKGLKVVPVGATGHAAEELWRRVDADFDVYFPQATKAVRKLFSAIGPSAKKDPDELTATIINLIGAIRRMKG
ncbi:SIR2 family protein [Paraburkholderia sp. C35]|uniref:SIR2 family protein n=1 Tax=Paraburkholderia sp. C35 TaxID=2126993 RepID=UPI000D69FF25|nr:SIR2 family protein [Paraburkholderia sp. C35]